LKQDLSRLAEKSAIFASKRKLPRRLCAVKPANPDPRPGLTLFRREYDLLSILGYGEMSEH
jgi:hypothetical protein